MNIKLDQDVRIRLSEEDILTLKSDLRLTRVFKIGPLTFQVNICHHPQGPKSGVFHESQMLTVVMATDDYMRLISSPTSFDGILIDDINIQIDRWSTEKRNRNKELKI